MVTAWLSNEASSIAYYIDLFFVFFTKNNLSAIYILPTDNKLLFVIFGYYVIDFRYSAVSNIYQTLDTVFSFSIVKHRIVNRLVLLD